MTLKKRPTPRPGNPEAMSSSFLAEQIVGTTIAARMQVLDVMSPDNSQKHHPTWGSSSSSSSSRCLKERSDGSRHFESI